MELWTAFTLGLFGSFHCVGMCGPIAMSIPRNTSGFFSLSGNAIIYNAGRISAYSVFGLLFGFLGTQITISGFQGWLSILLGIGLVAGVIYNRNFKKYRIHTSGIVTDKITNWYAILLRKQSVPALFGMGILNGMLPCAFVYAGLAAAVLTQSPFHSMSYMALFGLGTFPAMFLMYMAPSILSLDLRNSIRKMVPYLAFGLGVFLIIRGVALQDLQLSRILAEGMESFCVFPGTEL